MPDFEKTHGSRDLLCAGPLISVAVTTEHITSVDQLIEDVAAGHGNAVVGIARIDTGRQHCIISDATRLALSLPPGLDDDSRYRGRVWMFSRPQDRARCVTDAFVCDPAPVDGWFARLTVGGMFRTVEVIAIVGRDLLEGVRFEYDGVGGAIKLSW